MPAVRSTYIVKSCDKCPFVDEYYGACNHTKGKGITPTYERVHENCPLRRMSLEVKLAN